MAERELEKLIETERRKLEALRRAVRELEAGNPYTALFYFNLYYELSYIQSTLVSAVRRGIVKALTEGKEPPGKYAGISGYYREFILPELVEACKEYFIHPERVETAIKRIMRRG